MSSGYGYTVRGIVKAKEPTAKAAKGTKQTKAKKASAPAKKKAVKKKK